MKNRGQIVDGTVEDEFEYMAASWRGVFLKEHNEDGTHIVEPPLDNLVPTGSATMWLTDTAPSGWYLCDGSTRNRLEDKRLFDVIGVTFGVGDGSLTFNLPDLRGRFPLGKSASGTGATLADTGGAIDHTHGGGTTGATAPATDSQGAHDHGGSTGSESSHTHAQGAHNHAISSVGAGDESIIIGNLIERAGATQIDIFNDAGTGPGSAHAHSVSSGGAHTHTVASHTHSGGTTGTANPPFLVINWIIKS